MKYKLYLLYTQEFLLQWFNLTGTSTKYSGMYFLPSAKVANKICQKQIDKT